MNLKTGVNIKRRILFQVSFIAVFFCPAFLIFAKESFLDEVSLTTRISTDFYYFNVNDRGGDSELDFSDVDQQLDYDFEPVAMAAIDASIGYKSFVIDLDYKSNQFWSYGGSIETSDNVPSDLTDNAFISRILGIGFRIFNFHTAYQLIRFDFGTVHVLDADSGAVKQSSNLDLQIQQFDLSYDLLDLGKIEWENTSGDTSMFTDGLITTAPVFVLGYRYLDYSLPRIIYRFTDTVEGSGDNWTYSGETIPQNVGYGIHLGGFGLESTCPVKEKPSQLIYSGRFYLGAGKADFKFGNDNKSPTLSTMVINGHIGYLFNTRFKDYPVSFRFDYMLDIIFTESAETNWEINGDYSESTTQYSFGSADYLHHGGVSIVFTL